MSVPVKTLTNDQKVWYARFVIGAILADDEISPSEVDFLKQVIGIVESPSEKKELMSLISSKKRPALSSPQGIPKEVLAAIFIELILIMISDLDFAEQEKEFLKEVSRLFNFTKSYYTELMNWGEAGLNWKNSQKYLIRKDGKIENFQVPLDKLTSEQKNWYAKVLIATIMLDGLVDDSELQFLKAAMSFLDNKKDQQQLVGYVRNKMSPPLSEPPDVPEDILLLIFFEVILIVSADESLSYAEQTHLKNICNLCGFSEDVISKAIEWCHQGINWKQNKNPLIGRCKFGSMPLKQQAQGPLEHHPENNSVLFRNLHCFVCDSPQVIKAFQLKPHSQEPHRNIFGITTYLESLTGNDYIDYNLIRPIVCPTCFFASTEKNLFRKSKTETPPKILENRKFKQFWLKDIEQKKVSLNGALGELSDIDRSVSTAVKSYQLAEKSARILAKVNHDQTFEWQVVTYKLYMAELLMSDGMENKAEEALEQARQLADELFKNAASNMTAIKSARLLYFIALYKNDVRVAGPYVDYIRNLHLNQTTTLNPNELAVLKKVYGETQIALKNRGDYKKEKLLGFHMAI